MCIIKKYKKDRMSGLSLSNLVMATSDHTPMAPRVIVLTIVGSKLEIC